MHSDNQCRFLLAGITLLLLMTSCVKTIKDKKPAQTPQPLAQMKPGGQLYLLDNQSSQILIKVGKTGVLAKLGHNHLLLVKEMQGAIYLYDSIEQSRVYIRFPVAAIEVDPSDLRKLGGKDYLKPIGIKDKQSTYQNMLSNKVLAANAFPFITLGSLQIVGVEPELMMTTLIQVKDHTRTFDIPITLERNDNYLCVTGKLSFQQTDFEIVPFSIFMGALQVEDEVNIDFKVCATRQQLNAA